VSLQDNLIQIQHNVETGEVIELPISKEQIKFEIGADIVAMREANAAKEAAKKAVFEKLGLNEQEIALIL
jgi:hypothetical protein